MSRAGSALGIVVLAIVLVAGVAYVGVAETDAGPTAQVSVSDKRQSFTPAPLHGIGDESSPAPGFDAANQRPPSSDQAMPRTWSPVGPPVSSWDRPNLPEQEPVPVLETPAREATVQSEPDWARIRGALAEADDQPALLAASDRWLEARDGGASFEEEETEAGERSRYWAWESPDGRFVQLDVGRYHNCALREDGSAFCWGEQHPRALGDHGQLEAPEGRFIQVSAGDTHSCGLLEDCSVVCWGRQEFGEIRGQYPGMEDLDVVEQPPGEFTMVHAGFRGTCGLRVDGSVDCWGSLPSTAPPPPLLASPPGLFLQVALPWVHPEFCGLTADGRVLCLWDGGYITTELSGGPFVQLSVSGPQICGLRADGRAVCERALVSNDLLTVATPSDSFVQISVGGDVNGNPNSANGCGIRPDGSLSCWGDYDPWLLETPEGSFSYVGVGIHHACALREDGTIECWGEQSSN